MSAIAEAPMATEAFAEYLLAQVNGAALSLMISIGHRTGLFDAMAQIPPSTSQQIATATNLNERYVREWLGAMVTGRIIAHDPDSGTYALPESHAALLTRNAAPDNMAVFTQWISVLGSVESKIVDCFRNGGGLPYEAYDRFHEVMAEESGQTTVAALVDKILPIVPGLIDKLESGIEVLELGCGQGRALMKMAKEFPKSKFTGSDFTLQAVERAQKLADESGLKNIRFEQKDAALVNEEDRYDLICTFDAVHDQAKPDVVLKNIARALKPDGVFLMQDIKSHTHVHDNLDNPLAPLIYTISCMHCMSVSLGQGGAGLGAAWGEELAKQMLADAGFSKVKMKNLDHDITNSYYIVQL